MAKNDKNMPTGENAANMFADALLYESIREAGTLIRSRGSSLPPEPQILSVTKDELG